MSENEVELEKTGLRRATFVGTTLYFFMFYVVICRLNFYLKIIMVWKQIIGG